MKRKEGKRLKNIFEEQEEFRRTGMKQLVGDVTNSAAKEISINIFSIQHFFFFKEEEESSDFGHGSTLLPTGFSKC